MLFHGLLCCHIHQIVLLRPRRRRVAYARRLRVSTAALQIRRRAAPQRRAPSAEQDKSARETLLIFPTSGGKVGVHVDSTFLDTDPPSVIGLWVPPPPPTRLIKTQNLLLFCCSSPRFFATPSRATIPRHTTLSGSSRGGDARKRLPLHVRRVPIPTAPHHPPHPPHQRAAAPLHATSQLRLCADSLPRFAPGCPALTRSWSRVDLSALAQTSCWREKCRSLLRKQTRVGPPCLWQLVILCCYMEAWLICLIKIPAPLPATRTPPLAPHPRSPSLPPCQVFPFTAPCACGAADLTAPAATASTPSTWRATGRVQIGFRGPAIARRLADEIN
jgi:hypothetical protein